MPSSCAGAVCWRFLGFILRCSARFSFRQFWRRPAAAPCRYGLIAALSDVLDTRKAGRLSRKYGAERFRSANLVVIPLIAAMEIVRRRDPGSVTWLSKLLADVVVAIDPE